MRYKLMVFAVTLSALTAIESACAQADGLSAVEGYVFDAKTLRPVVSAFVAVNQAFPDGTVLFQSVATDGNGFYSMTIGGSGDAASATVEAACFTKRGQVRTSSSLYAPLRPQVYLRNLYLAIPSRTKCTSTPQ